jgi:Tfp pilus assembly PilM family ATPase
MSKATGIHLTGHTLRLVSLERTAANCRLCALAEVRLPVPFLPAELLECGTRQRIARALEEALSGVVHDLGRVVPSLGGGLFQIQKVPLEVASEEDRRDQITWEVSQTLISPPGDYLIDFYPEGRAAFWVAVRREILDLCTDLYAEAGISLKGLEVEPMALFYACEMADLWISGRNAAILSGYPWVSFVAAEGSTLIAAETVCVNGSVPDVPVAPRDRDLSDLQDIFEVAQRWIHGDRTLDRRRAAYDRVFFCGDQNRISGLMQRLRTPASPKLIPLQPFSACDTRHLPESQRPLLSRQSAFGIAAGLAYRGLEGEK